MTCRREIYFDSFWLPYLLALTVSPGACSKVKICLKKASVIKSACKQPCLSSGLEHPDNSSTAPVAQGGKVDMPPAEFSWKCPRFFKISLILLHRLLTTALSRDSDEESHWGQMRKKGNFSKFSIYPVFVVPRLTHFACKHPRGKSGLSFCDR